MTLIEAMGTGLPIVATAVGGVPDMLTNGKNALLVENDPIVIADAFELYYIDTELRKNHGTCVYRDSNRFSFTIMASSYLDLYNRVLR